MDAGSPWRQSDIERLWRERIRRGLGFSNAIMSWTGWLLRRNGILLLSQTRNLASSTDGEIKITQILKEKFPLATSVKVLDISGGCGAMYEIHVESEDFRAKRTVQQHQMINQALQNEIKEMHGLRIFTSVPKH